MHNSSFLCHKDWKPTNSSAKKLLMKTAKACFVTSAEKSLQTTGGTLVTKPFTWKKALERMKAHSQSDIHVQACQALMLAEGVAQEGTII